LKSGDLQLLRLLTTVLEKYYYTIGTKNPVKLPFSEVTRMNFEIEFAKLIEIEKEKIPKEQDRAINVQYLLENYSEEELNSPN